MANHEVNEAAQRKHAAPENTEPRKTHKAAPERAAVSSARKQSAKRRETAPREAEERAPVKKKKASVPSEAEPAREEPTGKHAKRPAPEEAAPAKEKPSEKKHEPEEQPPAKKKRRARSIEDYLDAAPQKAPKRPSHRQLERQRAMRRMAILVASLVIALVCGVLYAGSCVSASKTNLPNLYLDGIAVGGLSKEETAAVLSEQGWDRETERPLTVELPAGVSVEVDKVKAGSALSLDRAVNAAFAYGHTGAWLKDLASWLRCSAGGVNLGELAVTLDEDYLDSVVRDALTEFTSATNPEEPYLVDKENECLLMRKGAGTLTLNAGKLSAAIHEALLAKQESLRYEELEGEAVMPDFEAIYQALAVEPQDATFTETWEVVDETVGCTFGVEQALAIWNETPPLELVRVPLTITYPEKTGEELRALLFRDKLGEETSYFPNSIQNRISNIELAASKIDGIVLNPGETFSYNEALGERTLDNGFLMAGAYSNGEVVEEVGGGICQVSSTLYCAVLYSQLGIKSRDSHYFKVDYLPWGRDATVSWPQPDFKFTNTRDYPVRIVAVADPVERFIHIEIWGTDTLGTHIELFEDRYTIYDETYYVAVGWNVYLYARVYDAEGNLLETRELPASTYHKHDEDIDWPPEKYAAEG